MAFPTTLTNAQDGVTDALAAHINAVETKIGIDSSAVTTSHDYKLSEVTSSDKAVGKTATQTLSGKTLTSPVLNGEMTGTGVLDEDTMTTNSSTKLATQQSIKAYVDSKVGDWTSLADTCVYASPSTFTIAGVDRTSIFRPGTRFYFTQTTGKYAVVEKSVFSTNTTVTITVNDNYVIANAAITAPYYSYALMPSGYPDYFQITPSTSNTSGFSAVNGYTYRYSMVGRAITISLQIGGTSNAASLTINLPATVANASGLVNTPVAVQDNGTWQASPGIAAPNPNTATLLVGKTIGSVAGGTYAGFTASGAKFVDCNLTYYV